MSATTRFYRVFLDVTGGTDLLVEASSEDEARADAIAQVKGQLGLFSYDIDVDVESVEDETEEHR